jgi:DNA-directed RNA polymerase alpha subunit
MVYDTGNYPTLIFEVWLTSRIMVGNHSILEKPLDEFALSNEFLEMVRINNFRNLGEITRIPVTDLLKLPYFGYRVLAELMTILKFYKIESAIIDK